MGVGDDEPAGDWLGFAYVTIVIQLLAFFAWYAALARGGVAKIGQSSWFSRCYARLGRRVPRRVGRRRDPDRRTGGVASVVATQRARVVRVGTPHVAARRVRPPQPIDFSADSLAAVSEAAALIAQGKVRDIYEAGR